VHRIDFTVMAIAEVFDKRPREARTVRFATVESGRRNRRVRQHLLVDDPFDRGFPRRLALRHDRSAQRTRSDKPVST
jgi:hypothetical protein